MNWVYILKSNRDNKLYIGITSDLDKRIKYHNSGKVRSTKPRRPLHLLYSEKHSLPNSAREREKFFKSGQGRRWIKKELLARKGA